MDKRDLAVIIPMNEVGENMELLKKAVESVPEGIEIVISTVKGVKKSEFDVLGKNIEVLTSESGNFCDLVNAAASTIKTKWFSILEFDDTYTPIWYENAEKYISSEPSTSVFMFLEDITDFETKKYIGFGNEAAWASSFSNEIGYIDNECLQNYFDFYLTGSIFNTSDWNEVGGLKPSIKVTFWYEFLLRLTNKDKTVFVIPKVGYNHTLGRSGSLTSIYKDTVGKEESEWLFDLAKREYFFHPSVERNIISFEVYKKYSVEDK